VSDKEELRARATELCTQYLPELKRRCDAAEAENEGLRGQVADMRDEAHDAASLGTQLAVAEEEGGTLKEQLAATRNEAAALTKARVQSESQLGTLTREAATLRQQLAARSRELEAASKDKLSAVRETEEKVWSPKLANPVTLQWRAAV
jgi:chromosome segregation ATPase